MHEVVHVTRLQPTKVCTEFFTNDNNCSSFLEQLLNVTCFISGHQDNVGFFHINAECRVEDVLIQSFVDMVGEQFWSQFPVEHRGMTKHWGMLSEHIIVRAHRKPCC